MSYSFLFYIFIYLVIYYFFYTVLSLSLLLLFSCAFGDMNVNISQAYKAPLDLERRGGLQVLFLFIKLCVF